MAQERLTMRKIREIIRLKYEAGLSDRAIAGACKVSNSTVGEYLRRARAAGLSWPLPEMGEEELYWSLFPERGQAVIERQRPIPDWEEVRKELRQKGMGAIIVDGIQGKTSGRLSGRSIVSITNAGKKAVQSQVSAMNM